MTKKKFKHKRVPQRTCVGCREVLPKRSLIRIVRRPDHVVIDLSGKMSGRGAYIHDRRSCWENALKGALTHALKTELKESDLKELQEFGNSLPPEQHSQ